MAFAQENIVVIKRPKTVRSEILSPLGKDQIMPGTSILQVSGSDSILQNHPPNYLELGNILPDDNYSSSMVISLEAFDILAPDAKLIIGTNVGDRILDFNLQIIKGKINENDWINLSFSKSAIGWMRLREQNLFNSTFSIHCFSRKQNTLSLK